ncbi:MAG: thiol-activated cytolysin family protein [Kofleriaceae bacterium]
MNAVDRYITSLPYLPVEPPSIVQGAKSADAREGDYSCSTQNLAETRQYDRIVAYAANSDSLYPGALVSADSVLTGLFTQVALPRQPMTISVSLENLSGSKSAVVDQPSLSSYRDALSSILDSQITGSTPANLFSEIEEVHSDEQLNIALGVQASWGLGIASLKSTFDWNKKDIRSRYVVRYTQGYYTVDVDAPSLPSDMLAPGISVEEVSAKMDEARPPAYVSSVTYGRMVVFTFESEYSSSEMGAALEFAYSGGVDVSGDVSVTYKDIISKSKITAFILGGDGGGAAQAINSYEALIEFIKAGGNYSRESPGAPIAYKLNYLKDNSPARVSFTTDYDLKQCSRVSQKVKVTLNSITVDNAGDDQGDDLELFGKIWVEGDTDWTLFDRNDANWIQLREGQTFGGGGPIAEGVIDVAPHAGESIKLRADLTDYDNVLGVNTYHELGDETLMNPFETGWRKESTVTLTGSGRVVRVKLSMSPI